MHDKSDSKVSDAVCDPSVNGPDPQSQKSTTQADLVESWEDDYHSDDPDTKSTSTNPSLPTTHSKLATSHKSADTIFDNVPGTNYDSSTHRDIASENRRPEKTTAVASRLIAAGLGVKSARTEDQRRYDIAVRAQARNERDKQIAAKKRAAEEIAKAKASIWDDG